MNVSLTPELERLVSEKVASGLYASASEVVREALRHMQQADMQKTGRKQAEAGGPSDDAWLDKPAVRAQLRQVLSDAEGDVEAGRVTDFDEAGLTALAANIKERGQARREKR